MQGYGKRSSILEEKKELLEKKNIELREKIDETKELTTEFDQLWEQHKSNLAYGELRGCQYGIIRNLADFKYWKDTVFWKYRKEFEEEKGWTLRLLPERGIVGNDLIRPEWNFDFDFVICAYCDMVLPTPQGPIVHIVDPFGEYTLAPAKNTTNEEAQELIGSIVRVSCIMRYYQKDYEVTGFKKMPYTLHDKVK